MTCMQAIMPAWFKSGVGLYFVLARLKKRYSGATWPTYFIWFTFSLLRMIPCAARSRNGTLTVSIWASPVDVTVFRKLKPLDYLSSYSHRGRYYTLREIARFDDHGLWSQADVWFSRSGTLLATAEVFVNRSPRGFFADELARALHVEVQDALHQLTQQSRVTREMVSGLY